MELENDIPNEQIDPPEIEYLQWIKGDAIGDVVTISHADNEWIYFNEGSRISVSLKNEYLGTIDAELASTLMGSIVTSIDPLNTSAAPTAIVPTQTEQSVISPPEKTPIRILFDKQKKNNKTKLILEFPVNTPNKSIFDLMISSFEPSEVNKELNDFILEQLDVDQIMDSLNDSILKLIKDTYKKKG